MTLDEEFKIIKEFEKKNKKIFLKGKTFNIYKKKKIKYGSKEHLNLLEERFKNGRNLNKDETSENKKKKKKVIPDPAVYDYIKTKYDLGDNSVEEVKYHHNIAMDAENKIGHYLEEFIYNKLNNKDWIWCTGGILRSIDFIKKNINKKTSWTMLQIKNSDNSQNSSSDKATKGTDIKLWFRRFSLKGGTNWDNLKEITSSDDLTEENFLDFLRGKAKN